MSYRLSRLMSTATASYGAYALADPDHLGKALGVDAKEMAGFRALAQTYGIRDLAISAFGMFGRSPKTVKTAMKIRILNDLGDGTLLALRTDDADIRKKVLSVTMGWAALNAVALMIDSARND